MGRGIGESGFGIGPVAAEWGDWSGGNLLFPDPYSPNLQISHNSTTMSDG